MPLVILSPGSSLVLQHLYTFYHKQYDFGKNRMCLDFLYKFSETFLILTSIQPDIIINLYRSLHKVPVTFSDFNET